MRKNKANKIISFGMEVASSSVTEKTEPKNYKEAMKSEEAEQWKNAIDHFHCAESSINVLRQCCNPPFVVQLFVFFKLK